MKIHDVNIGDRLVIDGHTFIISSMTRYYSKPPTLETPSLTELVTKENNEN